MRPRNHKRMRRQDQPNTRRATEQLVDINVRLAALKDRLDEDDAEEKFSPSDYYRRDRDTEKPR